MELNTSVGRMSKLMIRILYIAYRQEDPTAILEQYATRPSILRSVESLINKGLIRRMQARFHGDFIELTEKGVIFLSDHSKKIEEWLPWVLPNSRYIMNWVREMRETKEMKNIAKTFLEKLGGSQDKEFWEQIVQISLANHPIPGHLMGTVISQLTDEDVLMANLKMKWDVHNHQCDKTVGQWQIVDRTLLYVPPSMWENQPKAFKNLLEKGSLDDVLEDGIGV